MIECPRRNRGCIESMRVSGVVSIRPASPGYSITGNGGYVLPLKRAVREAEGIGVDGVIAVWLEVLDA